MRARTVLAPLLALALFPLDASAQLSVLETENLRLVYEGVRTRFLAPHAARCFENSFAFHRRLFDWTPSEKVTVLLTDYSDYGNAGATGIPRNLIGISIAPVSFTYETYSANERINTLMNHELVHVLAVDQASDGDRFYRGILGGKVRPRADHPATIFYGYLTSPRDAAPRWFHEGMAVFLETWMAGGIGRAQGAYDEMVFRSMVRDGSHFYDPIGLESKGVRADFQAGVNAYLYGARFFDYLAYVHSPEKLVEWFSRTDGSRMYFAWQFERTYGLPLDDAWQQWIDWEHAFQQANLDSVRRYSTTSFRDLSSRALGSVSRAFLDPERQELYLGVNYPGTVAHLAALSLADGSIRKIRDVKGPALYFVTSLAYDPATRTLFYTTDNNDWRDLVAADVVTGERRTLMKDLRAGELVFVPRDSSLWGIRHFNGISTLVRIPPPYADWQQIYSWPYGRVVYDIDLSSDGRLMSAAIGEINGRQALHLFDIVDLLDGKTEGRMLHDFGASLPANFVFSPEGRYLYGSSYYTGVSNIWRWNFAADSMEIVSNCETGFFRPTPVSEDSLIVFRYTGEGFVPAVIRPQVLTDVSAITFLGQLVAEKHPVVTGWKAGSPGDVDLDSLGASSGEYHAMAHVGIESVHPIVEGYKDLPAYGMRLNLSDPISLHHLSVSASYTPNSSLDDDERLHVEAAYRRSSWTLSGQLNGADFYDLFGPTKTSRKGYSLSIGHERDLLVDPPRKMTLSGYLTGYGGLERLPDYQNVAASYGELLTAGIDLHYENMEASLGAVDFEKGHGWTLSGSGDLVNRRVYPKLVGRVDLGFPTPIAHSSLWLRASSAWSSSERDEPFANFYFGGFGNNWVDYRDVERYREFYAFPGVELNEIAGTNCGKILVDWLLPPLRFGRLGSQTLHVAWARAMIFCTGIVTNMDHPSTRREVFDAGGQLDLRLMLLSNLKLTLSVGYAVAAEENRRRGDEFMFSLKFL